MILVDADNAMGGRWGDVDDGFAIAALLTSGLPVGALASVFGNTSEPQARRNNRTLGALLGFPGPYLQGADRPGRASEAGDWLAAHADGLRVVATGPLTNVAAGLARAAGVAETVAEIVVVGANRTSRGRWPPWWPFEFNLTADRAAAAAVMASAAALTVVPLDVARALRVSARQLEAIEGALGEHIRRCSRRWLRRARIIRGRAVFPVWDLVAALYVIAPELFDTGRSCLRVHASGWVELGRGRRPVRVVRGYDPDAVWARFLELVNESEHATCTEPSS